MLYKNTELFNVEHIEETPFGTKLYRFPKEMIPAFENRYSALLTTGCEIRFKGEAALTLGALDANGYVEIYRGNRFCSAKFLPQGQSVTFNLTCETTIDRFSHKLDCGYDDDLWRIIFAHDFRGIIYDIEPLSQMSPPSEGDVPAKTMLAYGSSITHGAGALRYGCANIFQLGKHLNMNVKNKGVGGGCMCESEMADFIRKSQYDLLFLELGVNMQAVYTPEEFYNRAEKIVKAADVSKPTVLVSPYTFFNDITEDKKNRERLAAYRQICHRLWEENKRDNFMYIDGRDIMNDFSLLATDMLHPSIDGHISMGINLAQKIKSNKNIFF